MQDILTVAKIYTSTNSKSRRTEDVILDNIRRPHLPLLVHNMEYAD